MLLQQLGDHLVAVLQFFFKLSDLLFARILLPFLIGLVGTPCKRALTMLKKLLLPLVVLCGVNLELVTQIRYWYILEQVPTND